MLKYNKLSCICISLVNTLKPISRLLQNHTQKNSKISLKRKMVDTQFRKALIETEHLYYYVKSKPKNKITDMEINAGLPCWSPPPSLRIITVVLL